MPAKVKGRLTRYHAHQAIGEVMRKVYLASSAQKVAGTHIMATRSSLSACRARRGVFVQ